MASFPQASPPTLCAQLYPPPYAPHALPISFVSILPPAQYWVRSTDHSAPRLQNANFRNMWLTGELRKPPVVDRARPRPLPVRQTAGRITAASSGEPDDRTATAATKATMRNSQQDSTAFRRFCPRRGLSSASHFPEAPRSRGIL